MRWISAAITSAVRLALSGESSRLSAPRCGRWGVGVGVGLRTEEGRDEVAQIGLGQGLGGARKQLGYKGPGGHWRWWRRW